MLGELDVTEEVGAACGYTNLARAMAEATVETKDLDGVSLGFVTTALPFKAALILAPNMLYIGSDHPVFGARLRNIPRRILHRQQAQISLTTGRIVHILPLLRNEAYQRRGPAAPCRIGLGDKDRDQAQHANRRRKTAEIVRCTHSPVHKQRT